MTVTLFKEVNYSLSKLIHDIDMGEIGLPEIQRPFVWGNAKVRDLFDSMYKGFPVGYLLFWANGIANGHRQIGENTKQKVPNLLIVDGQQRLTSLYAVIKGIKVLREDYRKELIYIAFNPVTEQFDVTDAAIRKNPEFIPDISMIWSSETDIFELAENYLTSLELATSSPRTPSLFAYYASLVLLKAPVLFSDLSVADLLDPATKAKKASLERHHLFPRAYLAKLGITEVRDTNQIANYALVEWSDNIDISDTAPAEYFPEYQNRYDEKEWQTMRFLHALPKGWELLPYADFLEQRRKEIAKVIRAGFEILH